MAVKIKQDEGRPGIRSKLEAAAERRVKLFPGLCASDDGRGPSEWEIQLARLRAGEPVTVPWWSIVKYLPVDDRSGRWTVRGDGSLVRGHS